MSRKGGTHVKKAIWALLTACTLLVTPLAASADSNYKEYIYNTAGEAVPAPASYQPRQVVYGNEMTAQSFSAPKDMACDDEGRLYVLDTGNDRIVVLDAAMQLVREIRQPVIDGQPVSLRGAAGLFIREDRLYVTDKENGVIYLLGTDGSGIKTITFQPQAVVEDSFIFRPEGITVDNAGIIQIQAEGCYNGLITLDSDGNMIGYFSANTVQASLSVIAAQFWRKVFSEEQQDNIKQIIPVEYSGITMDSEGFIYTTTAKTETSTFEIKKLNPYGVNILGYNNTFSSVKTANGDYGDLRTLYTAGQYLDTSFADIYVDEEGFIFAMDTSRGRIFCYDQNSHLICVFGGMGEQAGTFALPAAVTGHGGTIYVLDETKGSVTAFQRSDYVENIRQALLLDEACDCAGAEPYWQQVYRENGNYALALSGLGKAAYQRGEIRQAMSYFERAKDRSNYDTAFAAYRTTFIRENFAYFGVGAVVLAAAAIVYRVVRRRKGRT